MIRRSPLNFALSSMLPDPGTTSDVIISPSRAVLRRAEPTLSFQVTAPGARGFDVIVATDPALFDPMQAHRRTPKNFRSSRQDFQGEAIEIEAGFYLLPRAFLRDLVSVEPRPDRLYYAAIAYSDAEMRNGRFSVPPEALASRAPHVSIASDLVAENLSKVLGMAVERLGVVTGGGRVMALGATPLPIEIGGLPLAHRDPPRSEQASGTGWRTAPPGGGIAWAPRPPAPPAKQATRPLIAPPEPPQALPITASLGQFVDEDYAYGRPDSSPAFRDLDRRIALNHATPDYDDGFGPPSDAVPSPQAAIPPLDPIPVASPPPTPTQQTPSAPAATGSAAEDQLLQAVIAEGAGGRYEALNLDGGFRGRLGPSDPYYQRAHDGLRFGPHQAAQDTGELGELLALMQAADPAGFAATFGPEAPALLTVTTAPGPSSLASADGRGPRLQPVAGRDLWEDPWVDRFKAAARHQPFQAAMRGQILARRLDPLRRIARDMGIDGERGLAMLLAVAIHRGAEGAATLLRTAVNPFDTPARLGAALDALRMTDLGAFRQAAGLPPGDTVDDATHAALIAALRTLGPSSPVQVPDPEAILDALVTTAGPGSLGDALLRLRLSAAFGPVDAGG